VLLGLQARHDKLGGPRPALRVVSLHADDTNRAPTFDIDLDDLYEPDGAAHLYDVVLQSASHVCF
jgi:hypothetical protein